MNGKIMMKDHLENITDRLAGCRALLYLLYQEAGVSPYLCKIFLKNLLTFGRI